MRFSLFLMFFAVISTQAEKLPDICENKTIVYRGDRVFLHADTKAENSVYLLQNLKKQKLFLNHQKRHPSASAGWGSSLVGGHWSALLVSQANFSLLCAYNDKKSWRSVNCFDVLLICRVKAFEDRGHNSGGTYWLAENDTFDQIIHRLALRQIFISQHKDPISDN